MDRDTNLSFDFAHASDVMPEAAAAPPSIGIVNGWKTALTARLDNFVSAFVSFKSAESTLYGYISKSPQHLNEVECVEEIIDKWIIERCNEASRNAVNMGHLVVTPDRLPNGLGYFSFPRKFSLFGGDPEIWEGISVFNATVRQLADYALMQYDFCSLHDELNKLSLSIEESGFVDAAEKLGAKFGITRRHDYEKRPLCVKRQKGRYVVEIRNYSSWVHERINALNDVRPVAFTFEAETGTGGLVACFDAAIAEERKNVRCSDTFVASRTKVCEGGPVEGVFFKDKIKLAFKADVFEALVGFIKSYATSPVNVIEVE